MIIQCVPLDVSLRFNNNPIYIRPSNPQLTSFVFINLFFPNTIRVFLNSDAIYDNYKCVPLDDLFICALYNNDNNTLLQIEDR